MAWFFGLLCVLLVLVCTIVIAALWRASSDVVRAWEALNKIYTMSREQHVIETAAKALLFTDESEEKALRTVWFQRVGVPKHEARVGRVHDGADQQDAGRGSEDCVEVDRRGDAKGLPDKEPGVAGGQAST